MARRMLKLRRDDTCIVCGSALLAGTEAWWDPKERRVTCTRCYQTNSASTSIPPPGDELDRGTPGSSLHREYERRRQRRETRVRQAHPHVGGLLLALTNEPQHQAAFHEGELGEEAVAASLEKRTAASGTITLHNRRMPRGRGDIDHLAVAPSGVYVIDTKNWKGKVEIATPWLGPPKLLINRRDCTKLVDGLERQVAVVRAALDRTDNQAIRVQGALCFTHADLPWLRTQKMRGQLLLYRRALAKRLNAEGPLTWMGIESIARQLAGALPPA